MNNLMVANNESLTMSSREIARLVNSRHADLMRSIDRLSQKDVISSYTPMAYTNDSNGQRYFEYLVCKRDTYIIVAQNSPEFTAALVDRWQELETKPALTHEQQVLMIATQLIETTKQRDEAIATKAHINDKRTATLMNKASQDAKKIKKLESKVQDAGTYRSIKSEKLPKMIDTGSKKPRVNHSVLKEISVNLGLDIAKLDDPLYGSVNGYHVKAFEELRRLYL
jgi:phage regulator Rha-like protein